jgi:hypothetical protein
MMKDKFKLTKLNDKLSHLEPTFETIKYVKTTLEAYDGAKIDISFLDEFGLIEQLKDKKKMENNLFTDPKIADVIAFTDSTDKIVSEIKAEKLFIGVDLGVNGAVAVLNSDGSLRETFYTPDTRKGFIERFAIYEHYNCFCITEKVASMPQNGVKASHTFGVIVERTLYTLELCKIPFQEVTPQTWMKTYMLKKEKGETNTQWKNRLKTKAEQLFPHQKITLKNADAFLIAEYARRHY